MHLEDEKSAAILKVAIQFAAMQMVVEMPKQKSANAAIWTSRHLAPQRGNRILEQKVP